MCEDLCGFGLVFSCYECRFGVYFIMKFDEKIITYIIVLAIFLLPTLFKSVIRIFSGLRKGRSRNESPLGYIPDNDTNSMFTSSSKYRGNPMFPGSGIAPKLDQRSLDRANANTRDHYNDNYEDDDDDEFHLEEIEEIFARRR